MYCMFANYIQFTVCVLQCANYSKGLVSGSLCEPLCTTKEIKFTSCLGAHLLKLYVFKAEWKGKPLVIKSIRPYSHHQHRVQLLNSFKMLGYDPRNSPLPQSTNIDPNMKLSREQFIVQANATLFHSIFGRKYTDRTKRVLGQVVSECDLRGDGILGSEEIRHCWRIIETEEYMLASLLDGHPALFEVYGLCGEFYAEQFATPLDSTDYIGAEGFLVPKRPWNFRAEVAIALLDMLEELEDTPYGGLHYCDVKEANFGLAKTSGRLVAKLIDLDSGWLGEENGGVKFQLKTYNNTCAVDDDCRFIHCHSRCNSTSHTCSGRMAFNNFHVSCFCSVHVVAVKLKPVYCHNLVSLCRQILYMAIHIHTMLITCQSTHAWCTAAVNSMPTSLIPNQ